MVDLRVARLDCSAARWGRYAVVAAAVALSLAAWAALIAHPHHTEQARFWAVFAMWNVMMLAMMIPPLLPWLLTLAALAGSSSSAAGRRFSIAHFTAGYFLVWSAYCAAAALAQLWAHQRFLLSNTLALAPAGGGTVLLAAGLFQWTPLKNLCLRHCRSPLGYLLANWRVDRYSMVRTGAVHGLHCLGCCWALMAVGFAVGIMSLPWMGVLTLALCIEKAAPHGERFAYGLGLVLFGWGAFLVLT